MRHRGSSAPHKPFQRSPRVTALEYEMEMRLAAAKSAGLRKPLTGKPGQPTGLWFPPRPMNKEEMHQLLERVQKKNRPEDQARGDVRMRAAAMPNDSPRYMEKEQHAQLVEKLYKDSQERGSRRKALQEEKVKAASRASSRKMLTKEERDELTRRLRGGTEEQVKHMRALQLKYYPELATKYQDSGFPFPKGM